MTMPGSPSPDLFLARRAVAGQSQAWEELVGRYGGRIYNIAFQFVGEVAEAEDLTQEVFLKLYNNLHLYRGDVPLVGWALRLSRNLCIDHYRRNRQARRCTFVSEEILNAMPAADDPLAVAQRREQVRLVYRSLEEMSEGLAVVILLRDLQGWSYEELAAFLELPLGTVKSRLSRGREELARRLSHIGRNPRPGASPAATGKPGSRFQEAPC